MFNFVVSMKKETASCCQLMGGLNEKELYIISFLGMNKRAKMKDLSDDMNVPMSTLTSVIDKLVSNGYVERYHSAEDRRVVEVRLAEKGIMNFDAFMSRKRRYAEELLSRLDSDQQDNLIDSLETLSTTNNN
jgi:DNA-binding MarR family transcriptional regulator